MGILTLNLVFMTLVFGIAANIYLLPRIEGTEPRIILIPILLLHSTRHLGMMFLSPGAVYQGMPSEFAYPAAYGDLSAAILALLAIACLSRWPKYAIPFVWIFNIVGTADLFAAIALATLYQAERFMGPAYWIPAFWVPALLVTHYIVFVILVRHGRRPAIKE